MRIYCSRCFAIREVGEEARGSVIACSVCGAPLHVPPPGPSFNRSPTPPTNPRADEWRRRAEGEDRVRRRRRAWVVAALGAGVFLGTCVGAAVVSSLVRGLGFFTPALLSSMLFEIMCGGFAAGFLTVFVLHLGGPLVRRLHIVLLIGLTAGAFGGVMLGAQFPVDAAPPAARGPGPPTWIVALGAAGGGVLGAVPGATLFLMLRKRREPKED